MRDAISASPSAPGRASAHQLDESRVIDRRALPASVIEQLNARLYYSPWRLVNSVIGAAIIAGPTFRTVHPALIIAWFGVTLAVSLLRFIAFQAYRHLPPARRADRFWSDHFVRLILAQGVCFGAAGLFLFASDDIVVHVSVAMTVAALGAGATALYAADQRAATGFIAASALPVALAALAHALLDGTTIDLIAFLVVAAVGLNMVIITRDSHRGLVQTLILRYEREELALALIGEKTRAEAASRAKSDFLATMSHELRTPLNAIIGFSEIMVGQIFGPLGTPRYVEYCQDVHTSAQHLLSLINDILDSAKVEAGKYELREEPIDLVQVIDAASRLMRERASKKGIALSLEAAPLPPILADERAMRQILLNLLSNAVKFTPKGGKVHLTTAHSPSGSILLEISDTGIGIPSAELPDVLGHFTRASNADQTGEGGTGLGLPIVRGLVVLHGGDLRIASEPGTGTRVTIELPASRIIAAAA
jgi:two-component system cell cycle sensor histidine kinase PleC